MNETRFRANVIVIIYLFVILITTIFVAFSYFENDYFWVFLLAALIWTLAGMLSIWYAHVNKKSFVTIFLFIFFVISYWLSIYFILENNNDVTIINVNERT